MDEVVEVRFLVARGLPLLVAAVPDAGLGSDLLEALEERGLVRLPRVFGLELPKGVRVAFHLDADELRLLDADETVFLRAPRAGVDPDWVAAAKPLIGTMLLIAANLELDPDEPPGELAARVDAAAREGRVLGAIVGVAEERRGLPLLLS